MVNLEDFEHMDSAREPAPPAESTPAPTTRATLRSYTRDLLLALGVLLLVIVFLYQPVKVEGTSMAPLLTDQERIFINKFIYRFEPIERGDVVVFWYPWDTTKSFIKRVVALPGETVEIRQGRVYVNGQALEEPYVPGQFSDRHSFTPVVVPAGHYFVMGDHRSSSNDSRVFGTVPDRLIYGKAVFVYWPVERFGTIPASAAEK